MLLSRTTARSARAEPGEPSYTLDEARIHDRFHCLDGTPDQPVRIVAPGMDRIITIDLQRPGSVPWYAVTTWTESRSRTSTASNRGSACRTRSTTARDLRWLEPGQTEAATLRISAFDKTTHVATDHANCA